MDDSQLIISRLTKMRFAEGEDEAGSDAEEDGAGSDAVVAEGGASLLGFSFSALPTTVLALVLPSFECPT